MTNVRQNYMDQFVKKAKDQNYPLDHPIVWLDADTIDIDDGYFQSILEATTEDKNFNLYAPKIRYGVDWLEGRDLSEADHATRLFYIHEMARFAISCKKRDYIEESGLSMSLGTWLASGGLDTADTIGESLGLKRNLGIYACNSLRGLPDHNHDTLEQLVHRMQTYRVIDLPTTIEVSGRRIWEETRRQGTSALLGSRSLSAGDYGLYTERPTDGQQANIAILDWRKVMSWIRQQFVAGNIPPSVMEEIIGEGKRLGITKP